MARDIPTALQRAADESRFSVKFHSDTPSLLKFYELNKLGVKDPPALVYVGPYDCCMAFLDGWRRRAEYESRGSEDPTAHFPPEGAVADSPSQ